MTSTRVRCPIRGVRFLKLPAEMLIAAAKADAEAEVSVRDFASILRRAGIKLVADRVEHEDMVPALADLGIPLAQGFVFAAPRAVRAEVLGKRRAGPARTIFAASVDLRAARAYPPAEQPVRCL